MPFLYGQRMQNNLFHPSYFTKKPYLQSPMKIPLAEQIQQLLKQSEVLNDAQLAQQLKELIFANESNDQHLKEAANISDLMKEHLSKDTAHKPDTLLSSGFQNLDAICPLFRGELILIGGRPGMGKTQIALNILNSVAFKHPVLYYSFDLSKFMFSSRWLSLISGIPADKIISQQLSDEQKDNLTQVAEYYRCNRKIFINDTGNQSIQALRKQCEKYVSEHGVKLVCIDYIQLMSSRKYSYQRESELGYISRELKKIAKDLNICIIAMSQLSRAVEMRGGSKRPILSDLRQSGSLEQDADKVIMVYRPDYYNITEDEEGRDARCVVELIVAKNRSGKTGTVYLKRDEQFIKLEEHKPFEQFHFVVNRINELKQDSAPLDSKDDELPF